MTVGPWKPIKLETYRNRITDLDIRSDVSETLEVGLSANFAFFENTQDSVSFSLRNPDGTVEVTSNNVSIDASLAGVNFEWKAGQLQLWYPVGYGAQPLYTVEVQLRDPVSERPYKCDHDSVPVLSSLGWPLT